MRTSKFTPEQMVAVLRMGDSGVPVGELCRQHGISEQTYYRWRKRFGDLGDGRGAGAPPAPRGERKLKQVAADLMLDKQILKRGAQKKVVKPARWRKLVVWAQQAYQLPKRRVRRALV